MASYGCGRLVCGGSKQQQQQEEEEKGREMKMGASRQPLLFAGETAAVIYLPEVFY